jgi:hypothetical protein
LIAADVDGGPQLTADLGHQQATRQRALRVERREAAQRQFVIRASGPDREPEAVVER